MNRLVCVPAALFALSCRELAPPRALSQEELAARFRERTCSAVLAAYASGARPSMLEIELPGPTAQDPPARIILMAPHIVSAEACLGRPDPFAPPAAPIAEDTSASSQPRAPAKVPSGPRPQPLDTRN